MFKIFNEENHVEYMFKNGFALKEVNSYELGILSKYYFSKMNYNRTQVREALIEFVAEYDKSFDPVFKRKMINSVIKYGKKFDFINITNIKITKKELELISSIDDFKREKILFVMLVLAKFRNLATIEKNIKVRSKHKVNTYKGLHRYFVTEKHTTITKEAKVSLSVKDRNVIFRYFEDLGIVKFTQKCNFELLFIEPPAPDDEVIIEIDNLNNFVYYYYRWKQKGKYIHCEVCGCIDKATSNNKKYCNTCWKEKEREDNRRYARESMRRIRNS